MGKKVDVYTNEWFMGREMDVSEIIKEYPFLKNENFDSAVITINDDEITFEYKENTDSPVVVWRRNDMTGNWTERVVLQ